MQMYVTVWRLIVGEKQGLADKREEWWWWRGVRGWGGGGSAENN